MTLTSLSQIRTIYQLKNVDRMNSVRDRKESSAEHSWSCLILADYFLNKQPSSSLNRLHIYELLMYHDLVEIEVGDVDIRDEAKRHTKHQQETLASQILQKRLPIELRKKYSSLFEEYNLGKTTEARFAKAIDALDAIIHELDYKKDWNGWSEEFLRKKKEQYFHEFPLINQCFKEIIQYCQNEGYFKQK